MKKIIFVLVTAGVVCLFNGFGALAEDNAAGGGGGGQKFDPAVYRRMKLDKKLDKKLDRIKEALGATDDEWKVLEPKVEAVQKLVTLERMGKSVRQGAAAGDAEQAPGDLEKKVKELQKLVETKDTAPKAVKDKLKELRDVREKSKAELKKAQDELRELLTPRQEGQLLLLGLLD